jgi:hypothetical protein
MEGKPVPDAITIDSLSPAHKRQVQALRRPVLDAARSFGVVRERLSDLAPKVVKLYNGIVADMERFTFVDFVRMFDATVPTHAADRDGATGYRNHRTYYTLAYMRRLVQLTGGRRVPGGVRDSATDALARTLATILQIVEDHERVWSAIQQEFTFSERLMTRLRKRVEQTKPLIRLEATRPAKVGNVIHMERAATPGPIIEEQGELAQPGRSVEIPAQAHRRARKRAA